MAKNSAKKKAKTEKVAEVKEKPKSGKNLISLDFYRKVVTATEKKFSLTASSLHVPYRLSFGLLLMDYLSGGGIIPGAMVQMSGKEGSGKSTICAHAFRAALNDNIPIINYHDPENALTDSMLSNIVRIDPSTLFGGPKKRASYYTDSGLETFYSANKHILKALPDKLWDGENKKWYYIFDNTKESRAMMADAGFTSYNKEKFRETNRLWVETDDPHPQGVVFVDSYPALLTDADDDKDDGSAAMALDARAFSKNIKRIAGRLRRKGFIIFGVNQIRDRPGVTYGNPEYEPGGNALAFYSALRFKFSKVSVPSGFPKGRNEDGTDTSEFSTEKSFYGPNRFDNYVYINVRNTKNKMGTPMLRGKARILFSDGKRRMLGYDPVFDTLEYLRQTGRLNGSFKKGFSIDVPELAAVGKNFGKKSIDYMDLKLLIMAEHLKEKKLIERVEKMGWKPIVRKILFKELKKQSTITAIMEAAQDKKRIKEDNEADLED